MQVHFPPDAIDAAEDQGVSITEIRAVLGTTPNWIDDLDEVTRTVLGKTPAGRLITVVIVEQPTGGWNLWTAFEAGLTEQIKWNHIFGEQQ